MNGKNGKSDIVDSAYGIDDLMNLRVVDYSMSGVSGQTGFLAQELNSFIPQVVTVGGDDAETEPWMVDYGKMTPVIVSAIQEQQEQIEELKAKNAELEQRLARLEQLLQ